MCQSAPAAPPAPNYAAAATAQGAANVDAARVAGQMNNPNIITPYGNQTVTWGQARPDTQAYQTALTDYNTKKTALGAAPTQAAYTTGGTPATPGTPGTSTGPTGTAPVQSAYTKPDTNAYNAALQTYQSGQTRPPAPELQPFLDQNPQDAGQGILAYQQALTNWINGGMDTSSTGATPPNQSQFTTPDTDAYNAALAAYNATAGTTGGTAATPASGGTFNQSAYQTALDQYNQQVAGLGAAPTQSSYNLPGSGDQPTITQTLTPAAQAALDSQQQVQQSLAGLAQQGISTAQGVLGTPFNYTGPQIQTGVPGQPALNYGPSGGAYGTAQGFNPASYGQAATVNPAQFGQAGGVGAGLYGLAGAAGSGGQATGISGDQYGQAQGVNGGQFGTAQGFNAGQFGTAQGAQGLNAGGAQNALNLSGVAQMPVNAGMTGQQAILSRLQPQIQQNEQALAQRLANQGLTPGSEAFNNAMRTQGEQENDLYTQAALQGIGLDTQANAQGYGQALSSAGLYNSALGQNFGQGLQGVQASNQAISQNFGQGQAANSAQNAAIAQNFAQSAAGQQMQNQAIGQNFGQGATANASQNAAIGQNFGQNLQSQQQQNAAIGQNFGQGTAAQQLYNAAIGQNFGQANQSQAMQNQAIAQNAGLGLQGVQAGNAAIGQNFGQGATSAGLYNGAQNQSYNQALQNSQFGNTAAQQLYQQQLAMYNQPLNEIAALMSGSQIQTPSFQPYQGQNVAAAPVFQGAQAQGQAAQQTYQNQLAAYNAQQQGLYGLLGAGTSLINPFTL